MKAIAWENCKLCHCRRQIVTSRLGLRVRILKAAREVLALIRDVTVKSEVESRSAVSRLVAGKFAFLAKLTRDTTIIVVL